VVVRVRRPRRDAVPPATLHGVPALPAFAALAAQPEPPLDLLALALAAEFREVDADRALARLDALGAQLATRRGETPEAQARACAELLGDVHGYAGDAERYDDPRNSMLDLVLTRKRGLPILLCVLYSEVARRAEVPLAGVGLPGHFVVGHFGADPPLLLDPFAGGAAVEEQPPAAFVRPWRATEIAMRMLNNLVAAYDRRADLGSSIRAAEMRLALPAEGAERRRVELELRSLRARLN